MSVIRSTLPATPRRGHAGAWLAGSTALGAVLALTWASGAHALPTSGVVAAGAATISTAPASLTVNQSSQNAAINWQSFSVGQGEAVRFVQPNASAITLNRVMGAEPSAILGGLSANGQVFLVNPNGVLFGPGSQVNVGGLVASTLGITDADFMAGRYRFAGASSGSVVNQGSITADGGSVALLGAHVGNQGMIVATLGAVSLAAGAAMTLDVAGDGLLSVAVSEGAVDALAENSGLIRADGGRVLMTARSADALLRTAVNNTGVIEARTLGVHNGAISLMGDMSNGVVNVSGVLDASAPGGGDGGAIETSASSVTVAQGAQITTAAPGGRTGTWLIDPQDFTIGAGGNITGSTLSALLVTNSVTISTQTGADTDVAGTPPTSSRHTTTPGNGDITVNDPVSWTASSSTTTLTLNADRDVIINRAITAVNGNFVVCCVRDVTVSAAITTTNGSILLSAGRTLSLGIPAAITTVDGNVTLCAGLNINVASAITLTRGSTIPAQSLGLALGLVFIAGNGGTGPGVAGGTLIFASGAPKTTVTGPNAPVTINYNPPSYATPTSYAAQFTLTGGATLTQHMLLFPNADKAFDGTTAAVLAGFDTTTASGLPAGVTLVAGAGATATFDSAAEGSNIGVTYAGYSLAGANASQYALASNCCTNTFRTNATIRAAGTPAPTTTPTPATTLPGTVTPVLIPVTPVPGILVPGTTPPLTPAVLMPAVLWIGPLQGETLQLAVLNGGVRLPPTPVVQPQPAPPPPPAAPVEVQAPPAPPAAPYVAPVRPRKQDRN